MELTVFIKLLKYEKFRPKLMKFYQVKTYTLHLSLSYATSFIVSFSAQALISKDYPIGMEYVNTFMKISMDIVDSNDNDRMIKHIRDGLRFGKLKYM